MAFNQQITDRCKAQGFFKHIEWTRGRGILIKLYDPLKDGTQQVSFESGTFDHEYDQRFDNHRQFFLFRKSAVKFMLNLKMNVHEIAQVIKAVDGGQTIYKYFK